MDYNNNSLIIGSIIGFSQTIIGHPLDTLKTIKQSKKSVNFINLKDVRILLRGINYPLIINTSYNSTVFFVFEKMKKEKFNDIESGLFSGLISGVILSPFEYFKVNKQLNKKINIYDSFRGSKLTMLRESVATSIYFTSYFELERQNVPIFLSGGISGMLCWYFTYPIDTIKTNYQIGNYKNYNTIIKECCNFNYVFNKNNWNGIYYCLTRAFIVNSISFCIYDKLKN